MSPIRWPRPWGPKLVFASSHGPSVLDGLLIPCTVSLFFFTMELWACGPTYTTYWAFSLKVTEGFVLCPFWWAYGLVCMLGAFAVGFVPRRRRTQRFVVSFVMDLWAWGPVCVFEAFAVGFVPKENPRICCILWWVMDLWACLYVWSLCNRLCSMTNHIAFGFLMSQTELVLTILN